MVSVCTAYHSFIGEVEAGITTTIRRLHPFKASPTFGNSSSTLKETLNDLYELARQRSTLSFG
jgi:hypothetical protein